jgi:hypothetical protein
MTMHLTIGFEAVTAAMLLAIVILEWPKERPS